MARRYNIDKLISYSDDLVEVLGDGKDVSDLTQCLQNFEALESCCLADFSEAQSLIQDYKRKIQACKQKIEAAKSEVVSDEEIVHYQDELEGELQNECSLKKELRMVVDDMNDLELQRVFIEERKQFLKKLEKDKLREEKKLSMYASVTNIIPDLNDQCKISGHIVDRDKKVVKKFEVNPEQTPAYDSCNIIWKMINPREV